jgi:hypothetical protein
MRTALEEELSDALALRAASVPRAATERLQSVDYRPRRRLLAVPVAVGAGAAASAATAGTVLAVVLGGAAPAYAGWSATPSSSAPPSTPSSSAPDCISTLSSASTGSTGPSGTGSGTDSGTGAWQTLLTDVRGPFTITLLQNGTSYATCFTGPSFTEVNRITSTSNGSGGVQSGSLSVNSQTANGGVSGPQAGGVGSIVRLETTSSGDLNQVLQNHLTTTSDGPYTFIDGRVANGVTGVTLALDDGQSIVATVADGWFVAWWPGNTADATSAQVTKASGTTSEPFVPLSEMGTKFPLGGQPSFSSGVSLPPANPGTCTTTTTASTSGGPSVNCKSTTDTGGSGSAASGSSGKSGNSGAGTDTGGSGPGPGTSAKP